MPFILCIVSLGSWLLIYLLGKLVVYLFIYLFMLQWLNGVPCVCAGVCDECATF